MNIYVKIPFSHSIDLDEYSDILAIFAAEYSEDDKFRLYPVKSTATINDLYNLTDRYKDILITQQ